MNKSTAFYETSFGILSVTDTGGALTWLSLSDSGTYDDEVSVESELTSETCRQVGEYLRGSRKSFELPYDLGPEDSFSKTVLERARKIPYGETVGYGELAASVGKSGAARAVGGALHRNPLMLIIPCHRVVGADGSLVGFGAGTALKAKLLRLERDNR